MARVDVDAATLYAAADTTERDDDVRAHHDEGMAPVGLDSALLLAVVPGFCELERTRSGELGFS